MADGLFSDAPLEEGAPEKPLKERLYDAFEDDLSEAEVELWAKHISDALNESTDDPALFADLKHAYNFPEDSMLDETDGRIALREVLERALQALEDRDPVLQASLERLRPA